MASRTNYSRTRGLPLLPPLSQSRHNDMACQALYVCKHVRKAKIGESDAAARGTEIHQLLATYIDHLVRTGCSADLGEFDRLLKLVGAESQLALQKFRESHAFDPEDIAATEFYIALDADFRPVEQLREVQLPEYEGTLDLVLMHSLTEAEIDDWKSYYQVIEADTFQAKLYPLLLMCLNPCLERVKFVLEFVRYRVSRCAEYTRQDLPWLKELAQRERARQKQLHQASTNIRMLKASPGRHCTYCPLLLNGCPLAKTNPYSRMTPQQRLQFAVWLQQAEKHNSKVLKDVIAEKGPILCRDDNRGEYVADFVPVERKSYSYSAVAPILEDWFRTHPEEKVLRENLTISGISSAIKAKKRAELADKFSAIADVQVETELRIKRAVGNEDARPKTC